MHCICSTSWANHLTTPVYAGAEERGRNNVDTLWALRRYTSKAPGENGAQHIRGIQLVLIGCISRPSDILRPITILRLGSYL